MISILMLLAALIGIPVMLIGLKHLLELSPFGFKIVLWIMGVTFALITLVELAGTP